MDYNEDFKTIENWKSKKNMLEKIRKLFYQELNIFSTYYHLVIPMNNIVPKPIRPIAFRLLNIKFIRTGNYISPLITMYLFCLMAS